MQNFNSWSLGVIFLLLEMKLFSLLSVTTINGRGKYGTEKII